MDVSDAQTDTKDQTEPIAEENKDEEEDEGEEGAEGEEEEADAMEKVEEDTEIPSDEIAKPFISSTPLTTAQVGLHVEGNNLSSHVVMTLSHLQQIGKYKGSTHPPYECTPFTNEVGEETKLHSISFMVPYSDWYDTSQSPLISSHLILLVLLFFRSVEELRLGDMLRVHEQRNDSRLRIGQPWLQ